MAIHDSDDAQHYEQKTSDAVAVPAPADEEKPLIEEVSPEAAPAVEEFMEQAAAQNEAAKEELPETRQHQPGPYISFVKVSKAFGPVVVLKDVSFFVNPGETLCILGRSGVGKSVSLQMLLGFLKPDSGRIMVAGEDICGFTEREL